MTYDKPRNPTGIGGPKKGEIRNPYGRSREVVDFVTRARQLLELHTVEHIVDVVNDRNRLKKLRAMDCLIYMRIAEGFKQGGGKSVEALLDRVLGRPSQFIDQRIYATAAPADESESVSDTLAWVRECIGVEKEDAPAQPVQERPLLPAPIRTEQA